MDVFVVQHVHQLEDEREDTKLVGVYATEESAAAAVKRLATQPGFCATPDGFHVARYRVDEDHWTAGFIAWPRD